MVTYYSTQRPIDIGTIPKNPKPILIENYDERTFVKAINREAWGCLVYENESDERVAKMYELVKSGSIYI